MKRSRQGRHSGIGEKRLIQFDEQADERVLFVFAETAVHARNLLTQLRHGFAQQRDARVGQRKIDSPAVLRIRDPLDQALLDEFVADARHVPARLARGAAKVGRIGAVVRGAVQHHHREVTHVADIVRREMAVEPVHHETVIEPDQDVDGRVTWHGAGDAPVSTGDRVDLGDTGLGILLHCGIVTELIISRKPNCAASPLRGVRTGTALNQPGVK